MRGVLLLMPAALFTKFVGLFYKIPLLFLVGVEGMAYFLAAYHIYSLLFVLCSTGLPAALSLQIARALAAGEHRAVRRIFGVALCLFLSLGLIGTAALWLFAEPLCRALAMGEAVAAVIAIAPALFLSAFIGSAKGYFQGHNRMGPTALGEVLEAAGKLLFGLGFALFAKRAGYDTPHLAAFAIFGITAGQALCALVLLFCLLFARRARCEEECCATAPPRLRAVLGELCRVALPITLSASVMSLVSLVDTALISARLQSAGYAPQLANAIYSSYGNLAVPLYNLIPSLLSPITLALMPLLGGFAKRGEFDRGEQTLLGAVRITALIAIPASLGLGVFARPVLSMIYVGQTQAVGVAAPLLSLLALSVLPSALLTLMGAALQATGHTLLPVLAMGAGALVKLLAEYILLALPTVGILAAPISTLLCTLSVLLIEWVALSRVLPFPVLRFGVIGRPLLCSLPGIVIGGACYLALSARFGACGWLTPLTVLFVGGLVALCLLLGGAVAREDLLCLPGGERLCGILETCKLLKKEEKNGHSSEKTGDITKKGIYGR